MENKFKSGDVVELEFFNRADKLRFINFCFANNLTTTITVNNINILESVISVTLTGQGIDRIEPIAHKFHGRLKKE